MWSRFGLTRGPSPYPLPIGWGEGVRRTGEGNSHVQDGYRFSLTALKLKLSQSDARGEPLIRRQFLDGFARKSNVASRRFMLR